MFHRYITFISCVHNYFHLCTPLWFKLIWVIYVWFMKNFYFIEYDINKVYWFKLIWVIYFWCMEKNCFIEYDLNKVY